MSRRTTCSAMASTPPTFLRKRRSRMFTLHTVDETAAISVRAILRVVGISQPPPACRTRMRHLQTRVDLHRVRSINGRTDHSILTRSSARNVSPRRGPFSGTLANRFFMTLTHATFCILTALISGAAVAQHTESGAADHPSVSNAAAVQNDTPAQLRIAAAKQQIKADPKKVQAYNDLALALLARARESADPSYLKDADAALSQGLSLDADDFQLQRTQVALMLGRHQYKQAKERVTALNHRTPDDVMTYGYLAEADIALGNYPEAETNAQWMLNMRPNNIPGLLIGAKLRMFYGDTQGAIDFLNLAYSETSPTEVEDLAWIANQIASIQIESGQNDAAAQTLEQAEQIFPHYPYTTENLARVRISQDRANDALHLWKQTATTDNDVAPASAVTQTAVLDGPLAAAHALNHTVVAADLGRTTATPVFVPVPEALLTPHPTGTDHLINNAQVTIARNPNAATYAELG